MKKKGFTLIELLVVVAIIGVLATMVLGAVGKARASARDAKRISDIRQIERALEMNYTDFGSYTQPEGVCSDTSVGELNAGCAGGGAIDSDWEAHSDLRDLVRDKYLPFLPLDPINDATYHYRYEPWNAGEAGYARAGQVYDLCAARLEKGGSFCVQGKN